MPTLADDVLGETPSPSTLAGAGIGGTGFGGAATAAPAFAGGYPQTRVHAGPAMSAYAATTGEVRYGGFWRRLWGAMVDHTLVWFLTALIQLGLHVNVLRPDYLRWPDRMAALAGLLLAWLYGAVLMSSRGQGTLGQQVMDLRVTDLAGRRISFLRATARHFAEYGSALLLCLGYLPILFHERHQALHDLIAGTLVVRGGEEDA